jgi:excisionase family DNA binding protein
MSKTDLQNQRILSLNEACEYLGYKRSYVYKMLSNGILPYSKPNNKKIYFDRAKLESWMLSNASKSHTERQIDAATYENTKGGYNK